MAARGLVNIVGGCCGTTPEHIAAIAATVKGLAPRKVHPEHPAHPEHPQFGLKTLLDALGVDRAEVAVLPGVTATARQGARAHFLAEAMRPAGTTARWRPVAGWRWRTRWTRWCVTSARFSRRT